MSRWQTDRRQTVGTCRYRAFQGRSTFLATVPACNRPEPHRVCRPLCGKPPSASKPPFPHPVGFFACGFPPLGSSRRRAVGCTRRFQPLPWPLPLLASLLFWPPPAPVARTATLSERCSFELLCDSPTSDTSSDVGAASTQRRGRKVSSSHVWQFRPYCCQTRSPPKSRTALTVSALSF